MKGKCYNNLATPDSNLFVGLTQKLFIDSNSRTLCVKSFRCPVSQLEREESNAGRFCFSPMFNHTKPSNETLIDLYVNQKLSSDDIAKQIGVTRTTVCRWLRPLNVLRPVSGASSRYRKRHGQVVKMGYPVEHRPAHPRANNIGYVGKHILVVEKRIGRTPLKTEPVHHIDLDRSNFDSDNLYLCPNNSGHQRLHAQLSKVASLLIKQGVIKFTDGIYHL